MINWSDLSMKGANFSIGITSVGQRMWNVPKIYDGFFKPLPEISKSKALSADFDAGF